jgi:hypothetical protein
METFKEQVSYFLRDAQYRIAELGNQIKLEYHHDDEKVNYLSSVRDQLYAFCTVLFINILPFKDDNINYLSWDEQEIIAEIHYLRSIGGLNDLPIIDFTAYNHEVVDMQNYAGVSEGLRGSYEQLYSWDANNRPIAVYYSKIAGMNEKTIAQFFGL